MNLIAELTRRGGVARVATLREAGLTVHAQRKAVTTGVVVSPRRGWLALAGADPDLLLAAERGVLLTCVTAAQRAGLWVKASPTTLHVAAPVHAGHARITEGVVHWAAPVIARHPDACVDPLVNALSVASSCLPFEDALALWESAIRQQKLVRAEVLRLALPRAARRVLERTRITSDSGLETIFFTRLRWLKVQIRSQAWILDRPVDFLIGERLVVQIDGGHHVGTQRTSDIAHDAKLLLHGYHVVRISYEQVMNRWHEVQDIIVAAIAQGLHEAA